MLGLRKSVKIDPKSKTGLFLTHFVPSVMRPFRVLWNEMIGFLFLVLAAMMCFGVFREYRSLGTPQGSMGKLVLAAGFLAILLYFGITSFLRARRISRS